MVLAIIISVLAFILPYIWNIDVPMDIGAWLAIGVCSVACVVALVTWDKYRDKVKKLEIDNAQLKEDFVLLQEKVIKLEKESK